MYSHIIIDLDGTLLAEHKNILPYTKKVLIEIQEKRNIKLVLASGRPVPFMEPLAKELQMDQYGGYLISNNGATVYDCEKREYVFENPLYPEDVVNIINKLRAYDLIPVFHYDDHVYVEAHQQGDIQNGDRIYNVIEGEQSGGYQLQRVEDLTEAINFPVYKILTGGNFDYILAHQEEIRAAFEGEYIALMTSPVTIEFTNQGVDKAFSLDWFAKNQGVSKESMMAFGDGQNDYTLMQFVGHAVAMGNAVPEIKEIADAITLSNLEDGIGVYLNELFNLELTMDEYKWN